MGDFGFKSQNGTDPAKCAVNKIVYLKPKERSIMKKDDLKTVDERINKMVAFYIEHNIVDDAIGAVIMAHMPIAMAVLAHHGGLNKLSGLIVRADNETVPTTES